jgi:YegS/Rv2252/BmrU family lipid kinase
MHAAELAADAIRSGYNAVVAVGGDGTVNEVINGFFHKKKLLNPHAALGYLPSGTGSDLARALNLHKFGSEELLGLLFTGTTKPVDVGSMDFRSSDGEAAQRFFVNEASVGFSANIAETVNESSKALGGQASFLIAVFRCLVGLENREMQITVDGKPWYRGPVFFAAACNGIYFGGGMKVAPEACPDDGLFDLILVKYFTRRDVIHHISKIYRGEHLALAQVRCIKCRRVEISSESTVPLEMDGEQPGNLPGTIRIIPGGIPFLVPAETSGGA